MVKGWTKKGHQHFPAERLAPTACLSASIRRVISKP